MVELRINNSKVDLFEDERAVINRSIKDINDISQALADFTRGFSIPASDNNNAILKHFYRDDIANGLSYVKRIPAEFFINGNLYKMGDVEVINAQIKDGQPYAYQINFYGKESVLQSLGGSLTLKDLDFSAYDHVYNSTNIGVGANTGLFALDIIYPLASPVRRWEFDSSNSNHNDYNIAYHTGHTGNEHGIYYYELKPAIRMTTIKEVIESDLGITFTGDGLVELEDLYMWLHTSEGYMYEGKPYDAHYKRLPFGAFTFPSSVWGGLWEDTGNNSFRLKSNPPIIQNGLNAVWALTFTISSHSGVDYEIVWYKNNGQELDRKTVTTTGTVSLDTKVSFNQGDVFYIDVVAPSSTNIDISKIELNVLRPTFIAKQFEIAISSFSYTLDVNISSLMPDMKIVDWIKGVMDMFNLVIQTDDGETFNFTYYDGYYSAAQTFDMDKLINTGDISVTQPARYRSINLKYADSKQLQSKAFAGQFGREYGEHIESYSIDAEGEMVVEVPFEVPFMDILGDPGAKFPVYFHHEDSTFDSTTGDSKGYYNKPVIFYVDELGITLTGDERIGFITDAGTQSVLDTPHYFGVLFPYPDNGTTSKSLLFTQDPFFLPDGGGTPATPTSGDDQYNLYWEDTFRQYFNTRTRLFKVKANISAVAFSQLTLDKIVIWGGQRYTINKISSDMVSGDTELELITLI